jgi:hypothetical protein
MRKLRTTLVALGLALALVLIYRTAVQEEGTPPLSVPQAQQAASETTRANSYASGQARGSFASAPMPSYPGPSTALSTAISRQPDAFRLTVLAPSVVRQGDTFSVTIDAEAIAPVSRYAFVVRFDSNEFTALSANPGSFMEHGNAIAKFTENAASSNGELIIGSEQDGGRGVEGSGSVAVIQLQALAAGSTLIEVTQIEAEDGLGNPVMPAAASPFVIRIDG